MAEKKRKPTRMSRTSDERERYDAVTRLLQQRLERSFAELDRREGKPVRPWRTSADERIEELYSRLGNRTAGGESTL